MKLFLLILTSIWFVSLNAQASETYTIFDCMKGIGQLSQIAAHGIITDEASKDVCRTAETPAGGYWCAKAAYEAGYNNYGVILACAFGGNKARGACLTDGINYYTDSLYYYDRVHVFVSETCNPNRHRALNLGYN